MQTFRIPSRAEFLAMKRQGLAPPVPPDTQGVGSQSGRRVPSRAEFLAMKQAGHSDTFGVAGLQLNGEVPSRDEFMAMKQSGQVPQGATGQNQPSSPGQTDTLDYLKNAVLGFAARGNQAMTALNPVATQEDYDRIAAEKAWMEQNRGAGLGEVLADIAITAPAGGVGSLAGRALGTGALEGLTTPGGTIDKIKQAGYMALSSGLGEGVANMVGRAIHPFRTPADAKPLVQAADRLEIPLSAANRTGNKALQSLDAGLDWMVGSSKPQAARKLAQREAWQKSILGQAGEYANAPTPEVMGALKDRLSSVYDDIASRNSINIDAQLKADLKSVSDQYLAKMPTTQKGIVKSYLKDFNRLGGSMPARSYQNVRSLLDKQARGYANSDPATAQALLSIRSAMDNAMNRSVSPEDAAALMQNNREWGIMRTIEKAIDPLSGQLSPDKFLNELAKRNPNSMIYGKGDQTLNELARVGKEFVSRKVGDSGTAQRGYMMDLLKTPGLIGAGLGYAGSDGDIGGALHGAGMGILGSVLAPKLASRMMWDNGYLSKGMIDLTEGMRAQILSEMGRQGGIAAQHVLTARHPRRENAR